MRQILALGGGGGTLKIVSQRQNMSKCYYAHDPKTQKSKIWYFLANDSNCRKRDTNESTLDTCQKL